MMHEEVGRWRRGGGLCGLPASSLVGSFLRSLLCAVQPSRTSQPLLASFHYMQQRTAACPGSRVQAH